MRGRAREGLPYSQRQRLSSDAAHLCLAPRYLCLRRPRPPPGAARTAGRPVGGGSGAQRDLREWLRGAVAVVRAMVVVGVVETPWGDAEATDLLPLALGLRDERFGLLALALAHVLVHEGHVAAQVVAAQVVLQDHALPCAQLDGVASELLQQLLRERHHLSRLCPGHAPRSSSRKLLQTPGSSCRLFP